MSLLTFVREWRGRYCTVAGGAGRQCVDLANQYLAELWHLNARQLNAVDWATIALPGMTWVPNGPTNTPPTDSLVVWGAYPKESIGQAGHIAICIEAEVMWLLSFDQNWPDGSPCGLVLHDYGGVLGWHRPAG